MFYIVGLGNPGAEYAETRHNVGWIVLDTVLDNLRLPSVSSDKYLKGRMTKGVVANESVTVLYPDTFMNKSGIAVKALVPKEELARLIVIYDDIDIGLGEVKVSYGRGHGGHNGIRSIIDAVGSKDFVRIRVGIAPRHWWTKEVVRPSGPKMASYVLGRFTKGEQAKLEAVAKEVESIIATIIKSGHETAMNQYN
jgi:peptidyl-tRNA hydrolase, PTH1 family